MLEVRVFHVSYLSIYEIRHIDKKFAFTVDPSRGLVDFGG